MSEFQGEGSTLVAQARELRPLLSANAENVERNRRLTPENAEALARLGFFQRNPRSMFADHYALGYLPAWITVNLLSSS
jgi:hypothetical protein